MRKNSRCRNCGSERKPAAFGKGSAGDGWRCQVNTDSQVELCGGGRHTFILQVAEGTTEIPSVGILSIRFII